MVSLSIINIKSDANKKSLLLLIQNIQNRNSCLAVPIASLVIESDDKRGLFIESLDTTGLFQPRNMQTFYVQAFIVFVVKSVSPDYLETFSHPKEELLFLKSSLAKKFLAPRKLLIHWQNIFSMIYKNVMVHSNYYKTKNLFNNIEQLHFFDDDPKSKVDKVEIEDFLMILLQRQDFVKGGLVIAIRESHPLNMNLPQFNVVPNEKTILKLSSLFKISCSVEENIYELMSEIRKCDFSDITFANNSLLKFVDIKKISFIQFPLINENEIERIKEYPTIKLQPRKKK